jgi:DNA-binding LacI/PurR family transcriptional regulator
MRLEDIADSTGLSISTIYRIRGGRMRRGNRRHEEALRMLHAYNKLNIRSYKEKNIICLCNQRAYGHTELLMQELESISRKAGCRFTYVDVSKAEENIEINKFDGCLLMYSTTTEEHFPLPTVALNREEQHLDISAVASDEAVGMIKVFKYLQQLGHTRIGFFDDYAMRSDSLSYRRAVIPYFYTMSGLEYNPERVYSEKVPLNGHPEVIRRAVAHFCSLNEMPTAIVLPGDSYGAVFYEQFKLRGFRIPDDISFVAYDNRESGDCLDPPLTSVDKTFHPMVKKAIELLLATIKDPQRQHERILLEPDLVIKKSVADLNSIPHKQTP